MNEEFFSWWRKVKKAPSHAPFITIILPVYNAAATLERCLLSILQQTYLDFELIVIDGASTDSSQEIIRKYAERVDYWVSEKDQGIYAAMQKGINQAHGRWLYFLGADDILVNILHRVTPYLKKDNHIYYGDVYWPSQNRVYDGEFKWHKLVHKNICHQAIFYPRRAFDSYHYNLKYRYLADYDLNLRLWADRRFVFQYLPLLICVFQDDPTGKAGYGYDADEIRDVAFQKDKSQLIESAFGAKLRRRQAWFALRSSLGRLIGRRPEIN